MNRSLMAAAAVPAPAPGRTLTKDTDEELALFFEMRKLEKERSNNLPHSTAGIDQTLGSKPGTASMFQIAPTGPTRKRIDEFLNSDSGKNDYDWLLTPPATPLPSSDSEYRRSPISSNGTPKARPTVLKSRLANAPDPSRNILSSRQPTPASILNSSAMGIRRPSSSGGRSQCSSRPSTPTGRPTLPAALKPTTRSSTPVSRATLPAKPQVPPPRSSTPVRSSTPMSRPLISANSKPASRSSTPTRRPSAPSTATTSISSVPPGRSSSVTRSTSLVSKSSMSSRGSSPTRKHRPVKPSDIPGFSLDAPPNLRTSLPERPSSASRGRPGAPSSRSSSVEPVPNARSRRQSCSPSRGRVPIGNTHKGYSGPAPSKLQGRGGDDVNPVAIGNRMVERTVNMRRLVPPRQDTYGNLTGKSSLSPDSNGFGRSLSKQSLDMAFRHMDIRRSVPNNLRPLMASVSASSVYSVRSGPGRSSAVSVSDSPLATSSTTSSDRSVSNRNMICLDGSEIEDDLASEKGSRCSSVVSITR
ncbi:hypothetical protein Cni_G25332 [Canna indica]|uniref:Uncharacterized protein n=1 Tax=Canna indica TaxID=4628 RepID=A0AAQ3QQD2_9LILI|nr:hypothetical protein Cni_G25332 [Canna indica]